ncbi:MAG: hypothetical protein EP297_11795 [Gammaproteobacteria bacterium]|nr:MAG: hypothetical protein EP297_11795 [Gammaproteobacteria bacterium]
MRNGIIVILLSIAIFLSGCTATSGSVKRSEPTVGPSFSSTIVKEEKQKNQTPAVTTTGPLLDVIVPVFDPGLPEDLKKAEEDGIWPELRRAEANRFAYKMKVALENTGAFGAVRVTPDRSSTGDLYVLGKIEQSNGEEVGIQIEVYDISEKKWLKKSFNHTVEHGFYDKSRNSGKDAYEPLFVKAANYIVEELRGHDDKELEYLKSLAEIRFGASFSDDEFGQYLKINRNSLFLPFNSKGKVALTGLPSADDPMLHRIRSIRVRDQLFIDRMQRHYEVFSQNMNNSYYIWQESSNLEVKATREARKKAAGQAIVGILLLAGAAYAASNDSQSNSTAMTTAAVAAGVGGSLMLSKSIQTWEEANFHKEALAELGKSLNLELEPQLVEFEESTAELTGNASEQFNQWRAFLKKIYLAESTPDVQI